MFDMRLRVPEIFGEHNTTAYAVARDSNGRIKPNTLYRLKRRRGRVRMIDAKLVQAIADVLDITDARQLIELEPKRKR